MIDRMIRLVTAENIAFPGPRNNVIDTINVIREEYSEELMAYFIRSATGNLLVVNSQLPTEVQAKAISFIKQKINEHGTTEAGVLKKNFEYFCAGPECRGNCSSSVV